MTASALFSRRLMLGLTAALAAAPAVATLSPAAPARAAGCSDPVSHYGKMVVSGNRINGSRTGKPVMVKGSSMFWSNWSAKWWTAGTIDTLVDSYKAEVVRAAYGIQTSGQPYSTSDEALIRTVVNAAIARGIYVIIDWHAHEAFNDPSAAIDFFSRMAQEFGGYDNVVFEIFNEPEQVSWSTVKAYAEQVIPAIRAHSDNLIVVGTPTWSQDVDHAAADRITSHSNIAYTLHFYAGSHGSALRAKADAALASGIALFVTEMGFVDASGDGAIDYESTNEWLDWMNVNLISWANWAVNDKEEGASIFTGSGGNTAAGTFLQDILVASAPYAEWRQDGACDGGDTGSGGDSGTGETGGTDGGTGGSGAATIADFEDGIGSWSGDSLLGGPWQSDEWSADGASSLKADIMMSSGSQHYVHLTGDRSLSSASSLTATVRRAAWGDVGSGLHAKLYVKTGSAWAWTDSGSATVSTSGTTLTLPLSSVADRGSVREIGIQFVSSLNSSGQTAVYLDGVRTS
ncbi:glycoside hydrolase family 5 protein [Brachybacterium sp. DNPG3]